MNKKWKWAIGIILTPFLLFVILTLLLYFPPIQNWAIRQVTAYASEKTGMNISVESVCLEFPLDLGVEGIRIMQQNDSLPQVKDTVADVKKLVADIQLLPLFKKQIEIDKLEFNSVKFNTTNFVHEARVKGFVNSLSLQSHGIDLNTHTLRVNTANIYGADINVQLSDTVPPDTVKEENLWKIHVDNLDIDKTAVSLNTAGDTLHIYAYLGNTEIEKGFFDLEKSVYTVGRLDWKEGRLKYDNLFETKTKGLDYNHIAIDKLSLGIDSLHYQDPELKMYLRACSFEEKSGIIVDELSGNIVLDSTKVYLPSFKLRTPESSLNLNLALDLNTFAEKNPGKMNLNIDGSFGKQDIMRFMGGMPAEFIRRWPNYPLTVKGIVYGNMNYIDFKGLVIKLPTAFSSKADGYVANPMDMKKLHANLDLDIHTYDLSFATALLDDNIKNTIRIPNGISINGNFRANGEKYKADFIAKEGRGYLRAVADFNSAVMAYKATLHANNLQLHHFVPNKGLNSFTGYVDVNGQGTDLLSPRTRLSANTRIINFNYDKWNLNGMTADANIRNGKINAKINSNNPLLKGIITFDALTNSKNLNATVACDISHADVYNLRLAEQPLIAALCAHVDIATDMKDYYKVQGLVNDLTIRDDKQSYRPEDVVLDILLRADTTHAVVDCGDFSLRMNASEGYKRLMNNGNQLYKELARQYENKKIELEKLWKIIPYANVNLHAGKDNIISKILKREGYVFKTALMDINASPITGLNGNIHIDSLVADSMQLDTIRLNLASNSNILEYNLQVCNNKDNPQYVFNAVVNGTLSDKDSEMKAEIFDDKNKLGLSFMLNASMEKDGILFRLKDTNPIIGYKKFKVNEDNRLFLASNRRVSAKIQMQADDGAGVQVYTDDDNEEALQDITVSMHKFDLGKLLSVLPYTPDITGNMNGDFHLIQTNDNISVSTAISVDNMFYEQSPMGDVSTEFVYMPKNDGSHYIDGILINNGKEVGTLTGTYASRGKGYIDAKFTLDEFPLSNINGFIPDRLFGFKGYGEGVLDIKGSLSEPQVNGEIYLDSSYLVSEPYGVEMRFDNDPVRIVGSHLLFENFQMYAHNNSPLVIKGDFDFSNMEKMKLDLRMRAENFQLINSEENLRSEAFGKAFVNFFGVVRGPVESLDMGGRLEVLGSTDLTYILRDSPLTTDNQLEELVKFTDFKANEELTLTRPPITGLKMDLSMNIDEQARIICALNADKSNYIDIIGGGDLRMRYNTIDNLQLTGRYTLNNGEMKYSLPIIPLKTFTIKDGSYIEFQGDPMNPLLNITASEYTKASVAEGTGQGRMVNFECGVKLTQNMSKPGIEFTIDAPEDLAIHNELNTMTREERGKLAVSMLTTGMYLADGNTSSFTLNSALSAFLNKEINTITGNAMRSLGLDIGMSLDNSTDATGRIHTDYSFKFAKRFWNNRLNIIIGGKVSSNQEPEQNNTFFDNVSLEYRLDEKSSKYLKLFYNKDSYDWLEGNVGQYGVGIMWKRKLQHFKEIFSFKDNKKQKFIQPSDSLNKR